MMKHEVLQDVIINVVYMGGSPSLTEECGFGKGAQAYAKIQCAMSDHESDPLIGQYVTAALMRVWEAAGLNLNEAVPGGLGQGPTTP
jgi:hypothetical protein